MLPLAVESISNQLGDIQTAVSIVAGMLLFQLLFK